MLFDFFSIQLSYHNYFYVFDYYLVYYSYLLGLDILIFIFYYLLFRLILMKGKQHALERKFIVRLNC